MVGDKLQTNFDHMDHVELYKTPEQQRMERYEKLEAMAYQYEQALRVCGHGKWQWYLFFILGLGLMADGVEIFIAGFVLPAAEKDLCISSNGKVLNICVFQNLGNLIYSTTLFLAYFYTFLD